MLLFTITVKNCGALMIRDHLCPNEGSCTVSLGAGGSVSSESFCAGALPRLWVFGTTP